jgi:DNA-directed RNA polymerase specialized sigma24 family protein
VFVRARGDHFTRSAVLLATSPPEAEDLLRASLVKLHQAGPRLDVSGPAADPYLRKILVNTRRSWWRSRWRQGSPAELVLEVADPAGPADRYVLGALVWAALPRL